MATPQTQTLQAAISTPSPGSWRHPRADEIARRQKESTFDDSNLRKILYNGAALAALFYFWSHPPLPLHPLTTPLLLLLTLLPLYNILSALSPLLKPKDDISDIPLTPTQRKLLGLDPSSNSNATTPGTGYVTPPRYPRSPTPRNMSGSGGGKGSGSVYSTPITSSPSFGREGRGGEEVMGSGTLWPKGLGKTGKMWNETRRESYGSPSPLGKGFAGSVLGGGGGLLGGDGSVLGTNERSPSARGAAVGLNSKWLFQKGRSMSGSRGPSMYL